MDSQWHLGEADFFSGMPAEREAFMALAHRRELRKNDIVFFEEDAGDACFYLEKGLVRIFRIAASGKEPIFFLRRAGELFGLAEVMDSSPRKANAQALSPCVLHAMGRENFERFLAGNFRAAAKVIRILGRRLRYLGEQVGNLMTCDVVTRLAKLLVYMGYDQLASEDAWKGPVTLPVRLTQEHMAAMTGSCQQTVSEVLGMLQEEGLIALEKRRIVVLRPLDLLRKAEH